MNNRLISGPLSAYLSTFQLSFVPPDVNLENGNLPNLLCSDSSRGIVVFVVIGSRYNTILSSE